MALAPGDPAPDFELPDQTGTKVRLSDLRGRNLIVFFYPRDDTPVCTKESCAFRDAYADVGAANAEVLGISADDVGSHARFADKHQLPYRVLSDADRSAARAFGVPQRLGLLPARMTFVIDAEGVIRHVTHADLQAERHVREALEALSKLEARS
jgi:peroxiredoxin Q/BCP